MNTESLTVSRVSAWSNADAVGSRKGWNHADGLAERLPRDGWRASPWNLGGSGFSLIEVAVAILLLGVALVPLSMLFRQSATGTVQTRDEVLAYGLASDLLHLAKGLSFGDPLLAPGQRDVQTLAQLGSVPLDSRFVRSLTVTEGQATGALVPYRYKILVARVAWESGGVARAIRMTGLIFRGKA